MAFDGQFYKIAVRDQPLTLLQLMKDSSSKTTKMRKDEQIQHIIKANHVSGFRDIHESTVYVDIEYQLEKSETN